MRRRRNRGMVGAAIRVMVVGFQCGQIYLYQFLRGDHAGQSGQQAGRYPGKAMDLGGQFRSDGTCPAFCGKSSIRWNRLQSGFHRLIRDDILDIEELACGLLSSVRQIYPQQLLIRYKLDESALDLEPYALLQAIGAKRGMLISGGEVDTERAAKMLVGEFRASNGADFRWNAAPARGGGRGG